MRSQNPLAHWTASHDTAAPSEALSPLFQGFNILAATAGEDFIRWVRRLAVLAERFQHNVRASRIEWNQNLVPGTTLLHQIDCEDLGLLASQFKEENSVHIRALHRKDVLHESSRLSEFQT